MEKRTFDVLVIGAGPAGSFAAEGLAHAGATVALFDGRPPNEPKACGGGVTSKALKIWPQLLDAQGRIINEVVMYSPSGKEVKLKLKQPFAIYSRRALDSHLRERACKAGAQVVSEKVTLQGDIPTNQRDWITVRSKDGSEWRGKIIIGADGANSAIARRLVGPLPASEMEVAFGYRTPLPEIGNASTIVAFLPNWSGYAWAFPRLDHICFGIATTQNAFDHTALDKMLWTFMANYYHKLRDENVSLWTEPNSNIEETLRSNMERYAARIPGLLPETWTTRRTAGSNWALLGDAAGFADPVTGEGIYYALRSAELFVKSYLDTNSPLEYEQLWREDFGLELKKASEMRNRFYGNFLGAPFTDRMIEFANIHKGIRNTLCELVAGDQAYINLKRKLLSRALWPFS